MKKSGSHAPFLTTKTHGYNASGKFLFTAPRYNCENPMKTSTCKRPGKKKYGLVGWLIGLPIPIIIILLFVRGCDF